MQTDAQTGQVLGTESITTAGSTGILPNTGVEDGYMALLVAGAGALAAGGGLMVYRRRFSSEG